MRWHVLEDRVLIELRGTQYGDHSSRDPVSQERLLNACTELELDEIVYLRVNFTDQIATEKLVEGVCPRLKRTLGLADGFLITRPKLGVAIANADCALGILCGQDAVVVMHLGLDCLWRNGAPTVLHHAVNALGSPERLGFWVGCAIGPCCHGYSLDTDVERARHEAIINTYGADISPGLTRKGPRRGKYAYDHRLLAVRLAEQLKIGRIETDNMCTACDGLDDPDAEGFGTYFSHTRDIYGTRKRNLALAALLQK